MSANEIHVGDVGTVFTATLKDSGTAVDISNASTKYFLLRQPGGTTSTVTANFTTSGTDGVLNFTSTSSHFDQMGLYRLQAFINDGTNQWHTDIFRFNVFANLE